MKFSQENVREGYSIGEPTSKTVTPRGKLTLTKSYFSRAAVSPTFGNTWGFDRFSVLRRDTPGSELNLHG
jgi:hypothetical protein